MWNQTLGAPLAVVVDVPASMGRTDERDYAAIGAPKHAPRTAPMSASRFAHSAPRTWSPPA